MLQHISVSSTILSNHPLLPCTTFNAKTLSLTSSSTLVSCCIMIYGFLMAATERKSWNINWWSLRSNVRKEHTEAT